MIMGFLITFGSGVVCGLSIAMLVRGVTDDRGHRTPID